MAYFKHARVRNIPIKRNLSKVQVLIQFRNHVNRSGHKICKINKKLKLNDYVKVIRKIDVLTTGYAFQHLLNVVYQHLCKVAERLDLIKRKIRYKCTLTCQELALTSSFIERFTCALYFLISHDTIINFSITKTVNENESGRP